MKLIPLPVFFILLLLAALVWWLNGYLQKLIRPRENFGRLLLYLACGFFTVFAGVYMAVRLILWLFPHGLK
jgi:hypothetical protein